MYSLRNHISLVRFLQISGFLQINDLLALCKIPLLRLSIRLKGRAVPEGRKFIPQNSKPKPFYRSESVVFTLIGKQLPNETLNVTLACDNFFRQHKLFADLKARAIAAHGTAKAESDMPAQQVLLRDCTNKSTDYTLLCNSIYGGGNNVTFVDQKTVHMMTTDHDLKTEKPAWREARSRRNAYLEWSRMQAARTELSYLRLSQDYNNCMNSCDLVVSSGVTAR